MYRKDNPAGTQFLTPPCPSSHKHKDDSPWIAPKMLPLFHGITLPQFFCRFFRLHPYFQQIFPKLKDLNHELEMRSSPDFEMHALMIFAVFDDVVENLDGDVDTMIEKLESVARLHAKAEGFNSEFFQVHL